MLSLGILLFAAGCNFQPENITPTPTVILTPKPTNTPVSTPTPTSDPTPTPTEEVLKALNEDYSDIVVLRDTMGEYDDFLKLIEKMNDAYHPFYITEAGGKRGIIASDDVVLLKINAQWNQRGGTNTDLVDSVIQAILNHPDGFTGEIIVADNGQATAGSFGVGGSLDWEYNNAMDTSQSIEDVVAKYSSDYEVSSYLWDTITRTEVSEYSDGDTKDGFVVYDSADESTDIIVSYPKFTTSFGTQISFKYGIWDENSQSYNKDNFKVINMPVLKSHSGYSVTAAIKNYMGVPSNRLTGFSPHNTISNGSMGTLMAETTVPALNILDAIWINPLRGPRTNYDIAVNTQIIAVSTDPFALDYWGTNEILLPVAEEVGNTNIANMSTEENNKPTAFGQWMRLSLEPLLEDGHIMRFTDEGVRIFEVDK